MGYHFKNCSKFLLFVSFSLLSFDTFSASEATKKLIHDVLAKYGISAGGKSDCNTDKEPYYDKKTGIVRCFDNNGYYENNYWSPKDRLCKHCPYGTIVNKQNPQTCNEIKCQNDMELMLPENKKCPEGFELIKITNGKCPDGYELVDLSSNCPDGYEQFKNK